MSDAQNTSGIIEKIPPQNNEAEQSLLGSLLIDRDAIIKVIDIVHAQDFYKETHRMIFEAMLELFSQHEPIDILSLTNRLSEMKRLETVGGRTYLVSLANAVPTASHITTYANIVQKKATLRRLIEAATDITKLGYTEEEETEIVLDQAEERLFSVSQKYLKRAFVPLRDALAEAFERIDELHKESGKLRGLTTGFHALDNMLAGLQKSDLVILAARPSVGKTSLAIDIARHIGTRAKVPVGIFSLEMSKDQLVDRLLCAEAGVDLWRMRTGRLSDREGDDDFPRIGHAMGVLSEAPIYIDDSSTSNIMEIRARARRLQSEKGLGLLIIDYLQLMEGPSKDEGRVQEISQITRSLKSIARELNIPVLALSQLSRATEARSPAIPKLSDLRESGCLAGDTLIMRADTGALVTIKELVGQENIPVYSLNEITLGLEVHHISRVFSSGRKKLFQLTLRSGRTIKASANHPFYTINGWQRLDALAPNIRLATTSVSSTNTAPPSLQALAKQSYNYSRLLRLRQLANPRNDGGATYIATATQSPLLLAIAQSDILWDEIISITPLGVEEVFDATVPGTHNFIANDLIVHNSIEQDADVVMFIYRRVMDKGLKEVLPEQRHIAEIHIAKHRNGPTGVVELFFDEGRVNFKNLEKKHDAMGAS